MDVPCVARASSFCMPPLPLPIEAYPASLVPCLFHHNVAQEYYISVACCSSLSIRVSLLVSAAWSHLSGAQENSAKMENKSLIHGNGSPRVMAKGSVGGGDIDEVFSEFSPRALCSTSGRSQNGCWAVVKMVSWLPNGSFFIVIVRSIGSPRQAHQCCGLWSIGFIRKSRFHA